MLNSKILIATAAGTVAFFFLGWLVYGILLNDFMMENYNQCMNRPMGQFVWPAMIGSNLVSAYLMAVILDWTNTRDWMGGLQKGAIVGGLMIISYDLSFHAMTTMYVHAMGIVVDIVVGTILSGVIGAVIAMMLGRGNSQS